MNIEELKDFLKKFSIDDLSISTFLEGKKIIEKNENIYLTSEDFNENEIYKDTIIFVKLLKILPTTFLLNFIRKSSQKIIQVKSEKQALIFTYGKGLKNDMVENITLKEDVYYIVTYNRKILGYAELIKEDEYPIQPVMNIGEYLKENDGTSIRRR